MNTYKRTATSVILDCVDLVTVREAMAVFDRVRLLGRIGGWNAIEVNKTDTGYSMSFKIPEEFHGEENLKNLENRLVSNHCGFENVSKPKRKAVVSKEIEGKDAETSVSSE